MKVYAHIKGVSCTIQCGYGQNQIQWLADCALVWLQNVNNQTYKQNPIRITLPNGETTLKDGDSVFVYLKEDVQFINLGRN